VVIHRRGFLAVSGTALAGGVLAACGSSEDDSAGIATETGAEQSSSASADVALLNQALVLEQRLVGTYDAAVSRLKGSLRTTAQHFGDQEQQHADALASAVSDLGATPATGRDRYALPSLPDDAAVLRFAMGVEDTAIAQYLDLIPKFSSPDLRQALASILTVEAEHVSVLLEELGSDPVPSAFVRGRAA
jgi:rubrerythrin